MWRFPWGARHPGSRHSRRRIIEGHLLRKDMACGRCIAHSDGDEKANSSRWVFCAVSVCPIVVMC